MSRIKTLFPLAVPSSLPAFDKNANGKLKYYFKPSSANTVEQIDHLHVSIVRLDTNRNILNRNTYPYEYIFIPKSDFKYDDKRGYYYFEISNSIFPIADTAYKIQVRAIEPSEDMPPLNSTQMGVWIKNNLNKISEWSVVTIVMPITIPLVGVQNLTESEVNNIDSSGYNFIGFYEPQDPNKSETLSSYQFSIYGYLDYNNKDTWKLYSTSGLKTIGIYEKPNLSHVFDKDLMQGADYVLVLSIKTKNLYTKNIMYKIKAAYPTLEMYNTINTEGDEEEAKIDVTINAKQIIMKPISHSTEVSYILNEPGYESYPNIRGTHAVVKGAISESKNFFMVNLEDKWVIQSRVKIDKIYTKLKDCYKNPFIQVAYNPIFDQNSSYFTRINLCAFKENLSYPLYSDGLIIPEPEWKYSIIVRKEVVKKEFGRETIISQQNKRFTSSELSDSNKEFYIYLKENQGLMNLVVQKTY